MRKHWLITNPEAQPAAPLLPVFTGRDFSFYAKPDEAQSFILNGSEIKILVDGYIMPVESTPQEFINQHEEELIFSLFKKYGIKFINYVKGNFSIVITEKDNFLAFNDHLGIRKIFYSNNQGKLLLSNKFNYAASLLKLNPSPENIAIHSLLHHFVSGITFSKELSYSEQATAFEFSASSGLKKRTYWDISELANSELTNCSIRDLKDYFNEIILSYIRYFKPLNVCMTLTGGMDSRLILAVLLENNIKPGTYAYGNPGSGDVIIAKKISELFGLDFLNHYEENPYSKWFGELCDEILETGDSVTHFHRAFRLAGIKSELSARPGTDMIIGGYMGGEGIKGVHYDDLIITRFTRTYSPDSKNKKALISEFLSNYFTEQNGLSYDFIIDFIDRLPWYGKDKKINEFYLNFILNASNHLAQDINFYHLHFPAIINPYMDIDYLKFLFRSPFNMLHKDNTSANQFRRLEVPRFHCTAIQMTSKELADMPFSSGFSPNDYLFSKYYYALKRGIHKRMNKKYLPHFSYGDWYLGFVKNEFEKISPSVNQFFNMQLAWKQLLSDKPGNEERYWHRFTNIVMIDKLISYYSKHGNRALQQTGN
jgi:hypothetical protein